MLEPRVNFAAWPFSLPYWGLHRLLGDVGAWNAFVLLSYLGAGAFAFLWLRALALPFEAALLGGLVFALAPYRVDEARESLVGAAAMLLPLALWLWERRTLPALAGSVLALASIPLSGEATLGVAAAAFFALYAWVRGRAARELVAAALGVMAAAAAAGFVLVVEGEPSGGGAANALDFVWRDGDEPLVFLGWLTPALALAGAAALAVARRWWLAALLALAALTPLVLALDAPVAGARPDALVVAWTAVAALVAFAAAAARWRWLAVVALAAVAADLHVAGAAATPPDARSGAYAAIDGVGRLVELPAFPPDDKLGTVYHYYAHQAPRERPAGYAPTAPQRAHDLAFALKPLNCGRRPRRPLSTLGVRYVVLHAELFNVSIGHNGPECLLRALRYLRGQGYRTAAADGALLLLQRH